MQKNSLGGYSARFRTGNLEGERVRVWEGEGGWPWADAHPNILSKVKCDFQHLLQESLAAMREYMKVCLRPLGLL